MHPANGIDGKIDCNYEKDKPVKIQKDTRIGALVPPQQGSDGVTVFDKKIHIPSPKAVKPPALENVSYKESDNSFIAEADGYLHIDSSKISVQPFFTLETAENGIEAYVTLARLVNNDDFSVENLKAFLTEKGITYGILDDAIARIFRDEKCEVPVLVARGKNVVHGENGSIRYYFDTEIKPEKDEKGNIDYKELNLIHNVVPDDTLAEIIPAVPGEDGYTVFGGCHQGQGRSYAAPYRRKEYTPRFRESRNSALEHRRRGKIKRQQGRGRSRFHHTRRC